VPEVAFKPAAGGGGVNPDPITAAIAAINAALEASRGPLAGYRNAIDGVTEGLNAGAARAKTALGPLTESLAGFAAAQQAALQPLRDLRDAFSAAVGPALNLVRAVVGFPGAVAGFVASTTAAVAHLAREPMQLLSSAVGSIESQVGRFVGKLSPIAAQRFSLAVDNLYASIGKSLLPVMERFTQVVNVVGSMFNGLNASGQKTIQVLASAAVGMTVFAAGAYAVQAALTGGIGPVLGAIAGAMGGVAFASGALDKALKPLAEVMGGVLERVGGVLDKFTGSDAFAAVVLGLGELVGVAADLGATFAEGLMPAFNALAGVVQSLLPVVKSLLPLMFALNPTIIIVKIMAAQFELLAPILVTVANVISSVVLRMADFVRSMLALIGINLPAAVAPQSTLKDNTGMAARNAETSNIETVLQRARQNAFAMIPMTAEEEDKKKKADEAKAKKEQDWADLPNKLKNWITEELPTKLAEKIAAHGAAAGEAVASGIGDAARIAFPLLNLTDLAAQGVDGARRGVRDAWDTYSPFK
jgi:hypothetical protein